MTVMQNQVVELSFQAEKVYERPFDQVEFQVRWTGPEGEILTVPGFWAGNGVWKVRYSSPQVGEHHFETLCSQEDAGLRGQTGSVQVRQPTRGRTPCTAAAVSAAGTGRCFCGTGTARTFSGWQTPGGWA